MGTDTLLYFTLLIAIWLIPVTRSSVGMVWAALFVLLQWLFVSLLMVSPASASATVGFSLLAVHLVSSTFWQDPFSEANVLRASYSIITLIAQVAKRIGIKPEAELMDFQNYSQVNTVARYLSDERWSDTENYLKELGFAQRFQVLEGISDFPESSLFAAKWLQRNPESSMALLLSAQCKIKAAWVARGNGVAHTVSQSAQVEFLTMLESAKAELEKITELDDSYAEPYIGLITIAMGTGQDRERLYDFYAKAVWNSGGHYEAHVAMINAVAEKWGGEPDEGIRLAQHALTQCKSNSPVVGTIAVAHIERWLYLVLSKQDEKADDYFIQDDVVDELSRAYRIIEQSKLESIDHVQALNCFAFCFYMACRYDLARQIFRQLNGKYVVYPWEYCSEPVSAILDTGYAIDHVKRRLANSGAVFQA